MSVSTGGKLYDDVILKDVLCDNIRFHKNRPDGNYTATLGFKDNAGIVGLLLREVRNGYRDIPSFMVQASLEFTVGVLRVSSTDTLYIRHAQAIPLSAELNSDEFTHIGSGLHKIKDVADYNPVASAVVDIVFRDVHVATEYCGTHETNAVLHGGIKVLSIRNIEAMSWFPGADDNDMYASRQVVDVARDFELHRHKMAR